MKKTFWWVPSTAELELQDIIDKLDLWDEESLDERATKLWKKIFENLYHGKGSGTEFNLRAADGKGTATITYTDEDGAPISKEWDIKLDNDGKFIWTSKRVRTNTDIHGQDTEKPRTIPIEESKKGEKPVESETPSKETNPEAPVEDEVSLDKDGFRDAVIRENPEALNDDNFMSALDELDKRLQEFEAHHGNAEKGCCKKCHDKIHGKEEGEPYEQVNHPSHYNTYPTETIEMMRRVFGSYLTAKWCEMTAFKYRMRMGNKHGNDVGKDLEKERWYLRKYSELMTNGMD